MLPSACTDDRFFCTTQQGFPNPLHPHQQTCLFLQHTHNPDNHPFFHHHHPHQHPFFTADAAADSVMMEGSTSCSAPNIGAPPAKAVTRKNPAKRDRHSKICTAQGTRDRRMRLSLDIARKFFDLQDLLGFDKASKTVEWLLLKSRPAIEQLTAAAQSDAVASAAHAESAVNLAAGDTPESSPDTDPKAKALPRKTAVYVLGKESRGRARERAKERACRRRRVGAGEESGGILSLSSWSPNSSAEVDQPPATATAALGDIFWLQQAAPAAAGCWKWVPP